MRAAFTLLAALAASAPLFARPDDVGGGASEVARSNYEKAEIAREEGRLAEAVPFYKAAIEAFPSYVDAHAGFLECLRGLGDASAARELYATLAASNPSSLEVRLFRAASMPPQEAIPVLAALAQEVPTSERIHLELGRSQLEGGAVRDAEKSLRLAIKLKSDFVSARILLGDISLRDGKAATARKEYEAALEFDPSSAATQIRLAYCLHKQDKTDRAVESLTRLLSEGNFPRYAAGYWMLAVIQAEAGQGKKALDALDKLLALAPKHLHALIAKGQLLLQENQPLEAVKVFTAATEAKPDSALAVFCLGWANEKAADSPEIRQEERLKRVEAAVAAYQKCAEMEQRARVRDSLGFAFLLKQDQREATTQFKRARDLDPSFAAAENNLGLVEDISDNRAEAMKRYQNVIDKIDKKNVRAMVMLALDHWIQGSPPKGVTLLQAALKIDPTDDLAWTFLGDIQYDLKKFKEAVNSYEKATEINPKNFIAWYHMGIALEEDLKKYEEAEKAYRSALDARADPPPDLILRLAELNDVDFFDRLEEALRFYELYVSVGGTEPWVPERIKELKDYFAGGGK